MWKLHCGRSDEQLETAVNGDAHATRSLHFLSDTNTMRLLSWASLGLISLVAADPNATYESRNILPSTFTPPKHFLNVNLVRNINLEKSYPRETLNVVIENIDKAAQKEYYLPFEQGLLGRIGGLEAKDKKEPETGLFPVEIIGIDSSR